MRSATLSDSKILVYPLHIKITSSLHFVFHFTFQLNIIFDKINKYLKGISAEF